jgi:hypothetical protein
MPDDKVPIDDDCMLLRRVSPAHVVLDKNTGRRRLSSGAFRDPEMSVDAECILDANGLSWHFSLRYHANHYLVRFATGFARGQLQVVDHNPLDDNPAHTEVKGRKSQPICSAFRDAATWVRAPAGV